MKLTNRGFTLVELMIVIAIIGILAAALFPSMTSYLKRSRDAARTAHLKDISTAVGAYYADKETYPDANSWTLLGCVSLNHITTNYLPKGIPTDPVATNNNGCVTNGAYGYGSGTSNSANAFVLAAILENTNGGNTGTTNVTVTGGTALLGNGKTFPVSIAAGLVKGGGAGYVLSN